MRTADSHINEGAPWSDDDTEALTVLYMMETQPTLDEIGLHLGRSEKAIYSRVMRMQLPAARSGAGKMRPCMNHETCGHTILSEWKGHRLCYSCKEVYA